MLGYAGKDRIFTPAAVGAVRTIKYCALAMIGFAAVAVVLIVLGSSDDRAGGVVIGILIAFGSLVIATAAAMLERALQNVLDGSSGSNPAGGVR